MTLTPEAVVDMIADRQDAIMEELGIWYSDAWTIEARCLLRDGKVTREELLAAADYLDQDEDDPSCNVADRHEGFMSGGGSLLRHVATEIPEL